MGGGNRKDRKYGTTESNKTGKRESNKAGWVHVLTVISLAHCLLVSQKESKWDRNRAKEVTKYISGMPVIDP